MRRRAGDVLFVLGAAVLAAAFIRGAQTAADDAAAGQASARILTQFYADMERTADEASDGAADEAADALTAPPAAAASQAAPAPADAEAPECIGALVIPAIALALPVLADWSDGNLELAPCRQFGAPETDDLVIAGHNYRSQFSRLGELCAGDALTLTDREGRSRTYTVAETATVAPDNVAAVQSAAYPLVLYTCTPGAKARVAVFCNYA